MGCCIAPGDTSAIKDFVTTISRRPIGAKLLVAGDFNVNLEIHRGPHMQRGNILNQRLTVAWIPGDWVSKLWWEQEGLDLERIQQADWSAGVETIFASQPGEESEGET